MQTKIAGKISQQNALDYNQITCSVIVSSSCETSAQLGDLPRGFVNGHHIPGLNLLLHNTLNHLCAQVVDGFHLGGLQGQLADLGSAAGGWSVYLYFNNLTLYYLCLFSYTYADTFPKLKLSFLILTIKDKIIIFLCLSTNRKQKLIQ